MSEKKKLNLLQRINAIQGEVTKVDKAANVGGKYQAVTHDDVTRMLRPLMVKHGIVSTIDVHDYEMIDTGMKFGNRPLHQMRAKAIITYMNADDPKDRIVVIVPAHADDAGDKAPGKVMSYAQKYADMKTFRVTTGEDDEQRITDVTEATLTSDQLAAMWEYAEEVFDDPDAVLSSMAEKVFRVDGYTKIAEKHFDVAMRKLKNKAQSEAKG